jgi:hypothetical protein
METRPENTEEGLIGKAIDKFAADTGVQITVLAHEHPIGKGKYLDALADVQTPDHTATYAIETKRNLTTATLGLAVEQLKNTPYKGMLITEYVNPNIAERLREMGIAFLDLAGNAYLNEKPILIYIKGNPAKVKPDKAKNFRPTRAFQAAGLKVLFGLLLKPELLQQTYRDIAKATNVALGTVGLVLTDLRDHGYLYEGRGNERKLIQKAKIIEQWVTAYPDKLRPKLRLGKYQTTNPRWWHNVDIETYNAQWGGEIAAAILTKYLVPENAVIYADNLPAKLIVENKLTREVEGNVEILERFWNPDLFDGDQVHDKIPQVMVPPLLIYADLMATADDRNIETAKMIRTDFLDGYFG